VSYAIRFEPTAQREYLRLPKELRDRIAARVNALSDDPRPPGAEPLRGKLKGLRRLRVGDYRVSYEADDDRQIVTIVEVGHRRDVYRRLARRW